MANVVFVNDFGFQEASDRNELHTHPELIASSRNGSVFRLLAAESGLRSFLKRCLSFTTDPVTTVSRPRRDSHARSIPVEPIVSFTENLEIAFYATSAILTLQVSLHSELKPEGLTMRAMLYATFLLLFTVFSTEQTFAGSVGDLLYPKDNINKNIDHLEEGVQRLISKFGRTVDDSVLEALQSTLAAVQSARLAFRNEMGITINDIGRQRAALLYDLANQVVELEKFADKQVNNFSEAEQRFTNGITEALRAPKIPFVIGVDPQMYRPERASPVRIIIRGQHLDDIRNRLRLNDVEYEPKVNQPNRVEFVVDRAGLKPDETRFSHFDLIAYRVDQSTWEWISSAWSTLTRNGGDQSAPTVFRLAVRAAAPTVGRYKVEAEVSKQGGYQTPEPLVWTETNPTDVVRCVPRAAGEEFDTGYAAITILENKIHRPAYQATVQTPFGIHRFPVAASNKTGANGAAVLEKSPERLCVRFNSPGHAATRDVPAATATVTVRLAYRLAKTTPEVVPWVKNGTITWDSDELVELPEGFRGLRATVNFSEASRDAARVFIKPTIYGPLEFSVDSDSRTLVFRPLQVD